MPCGQYLPYDLCPKIYDLVPRITFAEQNY